MAKKTRGISVLTKLAIFSVFVGTLNTFNFNTNDGCLSNQLNIETIQTVQSNRCLAEKSGLLSKKSSKKGGKCKKKSCDMENLPVESGESSGQNLEVKEEDMEQLGNLFQELSEKLNVGEHLKQYEGQMEEFAKKFEEGNEESLDMDFCKDLFGNLADSLIESYAKGMSDEKKTKMKKNAQKATNKLLKYCLKEQKKRHNSDKK
ncbi:hypothetical protein PGO_114590 [Plasmodium gonderi]|uniref:Plasmodium RESA N-terminal domain-containing protein n=1 Tax=Plasmodium gonderi TaxID=77519 RepID=A0A1Y1JKM2_PLAGO|nr:hypothetical protein PGO_114590 [Plasmodium gonderi]GAW82005.1 hypothetical protein PGO_114590 [Plasmodium gonderi]